ncbi:MAG: antibiotic biosynthesis monooxygenase [Alphaproteobacteria bacterium]|nr:MAG: antibiotic biosynthesis monooxygenase [Alphaproteobacteria bacterium]
MTAFIARLRVKPEREQEFIDLQQKLARLTWEHEPDTLVYDMIKSRDEPHTYVVIATFKDEQAFQTHQNSSFHDELVPPILDCLASDMELELFDCLTRRPD